MSSTLERLFRYAKPSEKPARENFTTEALAAALREDPSPFFQAIDEPSPVDAQLHIKTQERIEEKVQPDVQVWVGDELRWLIEVKVDAGESGDQIPEYLAFCARHANAPRLVYLARHRSQREEVISLTWGELHQCAKTKEGHWWREMVEYMEGLGMNDQAPIADDELQAASKAARLLPKVLVALDAPLNSIAKLWPKSTWFRGIGLQRQILRRFAEEEGSMSVVNANAGSCGLCFGLRPEDDALGASVWIWCDPYKGPRQAILAKTNGLRGAWRIDAGSREWVVIETTEPNIAGWEPRQAGEWLAARLQELADAGVYEALAVESGAQAPVDGES